MRAQQRQQEQEDMNQQHSRALYELCSMIIQILKSPPLAIPIPNPYSVVSPSASSSRQPVEAIISQVSPVALASLFLGISIALMIFGFVTFVIGFILMPWVIALVLFFYFVGILSNFSSIFCPKDMPVWKF